MSIVRSICRAISVLALQYGTPAEIGFQRGQLLWAEIADMVGVVKLEGAHDTKRDWEFFREAGHKMLWAHIDAEYWPEAAKTFLPRRFSPRIPSKGT